MTAADQSPALPTTTPAWLIGGVTLAVLLGWGGYEGYQKLAEWREARRVGALLASDDPNDRCRAAWRVADEDDEDLAVLLLQRLEASEPAPRAREALAYAVGRAGDDELAPRLADVLRRERDGFPRQAMWLALARLDETLFREMVAELHDGNDRWDALGIAYGRLELGDFSDAPVLLRLAREGGGAQQNVARHALQRRVRPILEAVGQWPAELNDQPPADWTAAQVAELTQRCQGVALQPIADRALAQLRSAAYVRFNIGKLLKARERLASWLF